MPSIKVDFENILIIQWPETMLAEHKIVECSILFLFDIALIIQGDFEVISLNNEVKIHSK